MAKRKLTKKEMRKKMQRLFLYSIPIQLYLVYIISYILLLKNMAGSLGDYIIKTLSYKLVLGHISLKYVPKILYNNESINVVDVPVIQSVFLYTIFILVCSMFIIMLMTYLVMKEKKKNTSHGSARWGDLEDLDFTSEATKPFETSLLNDDGVVLGRFKGITLRDNAKTHILVSAPTRTGKGVSIIIPTLIDTWNGSTVVLDIKGENYQKTSGARKELFDNTIIRFAPKSKHSSRFNPMAEIRFMTEFELEDVKLICNMLCQGDGDAKKDPYWDEKAADLLSGVMIYMLYKKFLQNPQFLEKDGKKIPISMANLTDVLDFFRDPTYDESVHKMLNKKKNENILDYAKDSAIKEYVKSKLIDLHPANVNMVLNGQHPNVAKVFTDFANTAEQTFGSILSNATGKLNIFGIDVVQRNTSVSDFRINDLMNYEKPVSLYLVVEPSAIVLMSPLIRILLVQMVNLLTPEMDYNNDNKNHKHKCLLLLDEFPAIGKMEVLEKGIGYVAGYKMKIMIILQSLDQLYKIYGKENMFLSNCQVQAFYTANDTTTAEYVSKSLGKETIENYTQGKGGGVKLHTQQQQFVARDLLTPDEVRTFPLDKILLLIAGKPPFKADKIRYFQESEYLRRSNLPYIYSESCYDKTRQYYKNTTSKYPEIKYVPYRSAIKGMMDLYKENMDEIRAMQDAKQRGGLDTGRQKELTSLISKTNILKDTLKKYIELINLLAPVMKKDMEVKNKMLEKLRKSKIDGTYTSYKDIMMLSEISNDNSEEKDETIVESNKELKETMMVEDSKSLSNLVNNINLAGVEQVPIPETDKTDDMASLLEEDDEDE